MKSYPFSTKSICCIILLTLLAMVSNTAWGGKINFADLGLENGLRYSEPFDGGDFTVTFVGGSNDGKYYNTGSAIRIYGNGSIVVAAKSGNLKKIVITFFENTSNQPESTDIVDTGTYDLASHTWTGLAPSVTFTHPDGSGHWRIQAVEAMVEEGSVVVKQAPSMSFSSDSLTITKGKSFTEPALLYNGDGAITYSIDNSIVGSINANTGKLNITGIGNATVTATAAETNNFKRATASYSLTVKEGETGEEGGSIVFAELGLENSVQYTTPFDGGKFTVTFAGGANDGKYFNTGQGIRIYGNGTMTVAAKSGNLTKVIVTFAEGQDFRPVSADVVDSGTFDPGTSEWVGLAPSVTFTRPAGNGHWRVQAIEVTIETGIIIEKEIPTMSFSLDSLTITRGKGFTEPVLSYNGDGAITYSIDNRRVGTINANTGKLNITGIGNATITATAAETANFMSGIASYYLTVNAPNPSEEDAIFFATLGLENGQQYSEPFDGGDFTVTFVGGSNDGKYYNTGQAIRIYGNGSMTVAAKSGNLTKVIVTFAEGQDFRPISADVVDSGIFDPGTGEWNGHASSVTFTRPAGNGHWRVQGVYVVVNGENTPSLTINGETPFVSSTTVTITPSNADFTVYYTIDGNYPTNNPTVYTEPFTITETTTVKAIEEDNFGNLSAVVSKTFVKEETPDMTSFTLLANALKISVGKTENLIICLSNSTETNGVQFDIKLPESMTVATKADGNFEIATTARSNKLMASCTKKGDGWYRIILYSIGGSTIEPGEGDILTVVVVCPADATPGDHEISFSEISLSCYSDTSYVNHYCDDFTVTVTINGVSTMPGDANGDFEVNVNDVMMMVYCILDSPSEDFIFVNADLDGNGTVNITDVMNAVAIILGNPSPKAPANSKTVSCNLLRISLEENGNIFSTPPHAKSDCHADGRV